MLKVEIRSLGKDLERRDDLCDDLLNEIFRHEKKIDEKSEENDNLILKNKSRLAKINILKEELKKIADPPKGNNSNAPKSSTPAKSSLGKTGKGEKSQGKKKAAEKEKQQCSESSETSDNEEKWLYGRDDSETCSIDSFGFCDILDSVDESKFPEIHSVADFDSDSGIEHII